MRGVSRLLALRPCLRSLVHSVAWLGLASLVGVGTGCGPVTYLSRVTFGSTGDIAELRATNAPKMAPYEWTAATEYHRRAMELAGYARFHDANNFAKSAQKNAAQAKTVRDRRNKNNELPFYDPADKGIFITKDGAVKRKSSLEFDNEKPPGLDNEKPPMTREDDAAKGLNKGSR
jgi:hypothetical protein